MNKKEIGLSLMFFDQNDKNASLFYFAKKISNKKDLMLAVDEIKINYPEYIFIGLEDIFISYVYRDMIIFSQSMNEEIDTQEKATTLVIENHNNEIDFTHKSHLIELIYFYVDTTIFVEIVFEAENISEYNLRLSEIENNKFHVFIYNKRSYRPFIIDKFEYLGLSSYTNINYKLYSHSPINILTNYELNTENDAKKEFINMLNKDETNINEKIETVLSTENE